MVSSAMNEFKDQLDAAEKEKVTKHITELREIAARALGGDASLTADAIREKMNETQQASLGLFQKVYEKRSAEAASSEPSSTEGTKEEKKGLSDRRLLFLVSYFAFDCFAPCHPYLHLISSPLPLP
jgi:uncharacterized membrane protein (DUF106 family)